MSTITASRQAESLPPASPEELRSAAKDWLHKRGVPHFTGRPESREWHAVFVVSFALAFALLVVLFFEPKEVARGVAIGLTVGVVVAALAVGVSARLLGGKPREYILPPPGRMNLSVGAAVLAVPLVDAWAADDIRVDTGVVPIAAIVVLLAVAAATPVGALRILWWAAGHPAREFRQNLKVLTGALPLLLLTLGVLFMTTEIWVVATNLTLIELLATVALFAGPGLAFLLMVAATRIAEAERFDDWPQVKKCLTEHPPIKGRPSSSVDEEYGALDRALGKLHAPNSARRSVFRRQRNTREQLRLLRESEWPEELDIRKVPPLEWQERWNILLVAVVGQGFQVLAVSISLGLFFLIFGLLVVDDATLTAWGVEAQDGWGPWTEQHLTVSALVATFAGLSYAVSATLLSEQRDLFLCQLDHKMEQRLAVRALFRELQTRWPPPAERRTRAARRRRAGRGVPRRRTT